MNRKIFLGFGCVLSAFAASAATSSSAFQIGAVGPRLEARLTNESEASLLRAAGRLERLLKWPVHEEITQLAFDCPANLESLQQDKACAGSDSDYVDAFVMYGVRWNDMPPFRLNPGQGAGCTKFLSSAPACIAEQTVRFSTQPECWICLFKQAEAISSTKRITGCDRGDDFVQGTLMTRSHFGDLQFLHAMADSADVPPGTTRRNVLDWIQFAWRVVDKEFGPDYKLKDVDIPSIKEHFGCSEWTVSDLYVLGQKDTLNRRIPDIAFGSVAHTVQDSFAAGHVERESAGADGQCPGPTPMPKPGRVLEFHAYGAQDGKKHDLADERDVLVAQATDPAGVVAATKQLYEFWDRDAPWAEVQPFFECLFELGPAARNSSAGAAFVKGQP